MNDVMEVTDQATQTPVRNVTLRIFGIMFFAAAVSLPFLYSGKNYQEVYNLALAAKGGVPNIYALSSPDDPMPLYFALLRGLAHLFAPTLLTLRVESLVFFLLTIPLMYLVGRLATDNQRVGLLAALLFGISPFMVWYGSRATVYSLLVLVTLLNMYSYLRLLHKKQTWLGWAGYIVTGLLGMSVHYFFIAVLLAQLAFYCTKHREVSRLSIYKLAFCTLLFVGVFAIWVHHSLSYTDAWNHLPFTSKPSATNAFLVFVQFLFGFQSVVTITLVIAFWPLLVILALFSVQKYIKPSSGVQYFSFASFAPVLAIFLMSWAWKPLFLSSYFIVCLPPFLLLVSWYFVAFNLRALTLTRNILIAVMLAMLFIQIVNTERAISEDYLGEMIYQPAARARF